MRKRRISRRALGLLALAVVGLLIGVALLLPPRGLPPEAVVVARGLEVPWAVAEAPDGTLFVTERPGRVRVVHAAGSLAQDSVLTLAVRASGEGGLMGIALHPDFPTVPLVYVMYTTLSPVDVLINRISKFSWDGSALQGETVLLDAIPASSIHNGGRLAFGPDRRLYATAGDAAAPDDAQNVSRQAGKILRLADDGSAPPDNPFATLPGAAEHVWSLGHRNPQGLAWHRSGALVATKHGPSGDRGLCCHDEVNLIRAGKNYGWPEAYGNEGKDGFERPLLESGLDTWAPGGAAFLSDELYFGALRGKHLHRVRLDPADPSKVLGHEKLYEGRFGRVRDVVAARDGSLLITTSNRDGRGQPVEGDDMVIRLRPSSAADGFVAMPPEGLLTAAPSPLLVARACVRLGRTPREVREAA